MKKNNFFQLPNQVVQEILGNPGETPAGGQTSNPTLATVAQGGNEAGDPGKEAPMPDMGIGREARDGAAYSSTVPTVFSRMLNLATKARNWLFAPATAATVPANQGVPTFMLTVLGEGTTHKGKTCVRLSGGGLMMVGANGLFARFGVRHKDGRALNTTDNGGGFMPMAYLPADLAAKLQDAVDALDTPEGLQMQFFGGTLHVRCDKQGREKKPYQGVLGVTWDHNLVGVEGVRFVLPGQPGYVTMRIERGAALLESDFVYMDETDSEATQASARERMNLGLRTEAQGVEAFRDEYKDVLDLGIGNPFGAAASGYEHTQQTEAAQAEVEFINPLEGV